MRIQAGVAKSLKTWGFVMFSRRRMAVRTRSTLSLCADALRARPDKLLI
jgi:hypothetical protein